MAASAADIAREFDLQGYETSTGESFNEIHQKLDFYQRSHYSQFLPTIGPDHYDYETRLLKWLESASNDDDRRILFELAPRIVFFAREDLIKLHQAALHGPISRWLIDQLGLQFADPTLDSTLTEELEQHTWFTAITDSLQIADFHHANNLGGCDYRPDWRSLAKFGDPDLIRDYMQNREGMYGPQPINRIVILEDFIGSGTQMKSDEGSVEFAASEFPTTPILLV